MKASVCIHVGLSAVKRACVKVGAYLRALATSRVKIVVLSLLSQPDQSHQSPTLPDLALTPLYDKSELRVGGGGLDGGALLHNNKQSQERPFIYRTT